jgi:hypothetical protein
MKRLTEHRRALIRIERHSLGPRLHLFGRRVHEYQAGLAVLAVLPLAFVDGLALLSLPTGLAGLWLVVKDWPDLFPATRDKASWRLGLHRLPRRRAGGYSRRADSASTTSPCSQVSQP